MSTPIAAVVYFGIVFGAGFVLGTIRTLWLVARFGERTAELVELPVMIVIVLLAARFVVRRMRARTVWHRLGTGGLALLMLLACEIGVVVLLRRESLAEYVAARDPLAGAAYLLSLVVFALAPMLMRADHGRGARRPHS